MEYPEFRPSSWFKKLFEFEESVELVKKHIKCNKVDENYILKSDINNMSYNAGNFQVRYISSFSDDPKIRPIRNGGTFNIISGYGYRTKEFQRIDAFSMQSLPENDGATYLAASNFNCLEFTSSYQTARSGVTSYVHDLTQGPYTALACPQSAVLRNYFIEFEDEEGKKSIGQIDTQINLLSKTPLKVRNGYVLLYSENCEELKKSGFDWKNENNYAVGVHNNCEVLMTRGKDRCFKYIGRNARKIKTYTKNEIKIRIGSKIQKKIDEKNETNSKLEKPVNNDNENQTNSKLEKQVNNDNENETNSKLEKPVNNDNENQTNSELEKPVNNDNENETNSKLEKPVNNDNENETNFELEKTIDNDENSNESDEGNRPIIANHVYAASFNFNGNVDQNDFSLEVASNILKAEYKAAILAAWENSVKMEAEGREGARKLYLTLLGGGVFGNPLSIITNAIRECKNEIVQSGLEVFLVCFDDNTFNKIYDDLMPLVYDTGGYSENLH